MHFKGKIAQLSCFPWVCLRVSHLSENKGRVFFILSGDWGPVWLCQAEHGGAHGNHAGCRLADGRLQDAQLSGHQMGPECPEGTLCNHTQGTAAALWQHESQKCSLPSYLACSLSHLHYMGFLFLIRPYVKLWRSGRNPATHLERDDGAGPRRSAATSIFILSTVRIIVFTFFLADK